MPLTQELTTKDYGFPLMELPIDVLLNVLNVLGRSHGEEGEADREDAAVQRCLRSLQDIIVASDRHSRNEVRMAMFLLLSCRTAPSCSRKVSNGECFFCKRRTHLSNEAIVIGVPRSSPSPPHPILFLPSLCHATCAQRFPGIFAACALLRLKHAWHLGFLPGANRDYAQGCYSSYKKLWKSDVRPQCFAPFANKQTGEAGATVHLLTLREDLASLQIKLKQRTEEVRFSAVRAQTQQDRVERHNLYIGDVADCIRCTDAFISTLGNVLHAEFSHSNFVPRDYFGPIPGKKKRKATANAAALKRSRSLKQ